MKEGKKFKYEGRDAKSVKSRATQSGGAFDSYTDPKIPRYKVESGTNTVRILPPTWKDKDKWGDSWGIEVWAHNQIGPDKSSYLCLAKMNGEDCPLCEARRDAEDDDDDIADKLKPQKRILAYIIDRDDEKAGPQLWSMPWTVEREIAGRSLVKKTGEVILVDDPDAGFDVEFTREGSGLKTKYIGVDVSREESPISDTSKTQAKWLEFVTENSLPDILKFHDPEIMQAAFNGKSNKKDEDEDEDEDEPKKKKGKRDDDDDDDAAPKKSMKKGKRPDPDDDDDEDEEDEPKKKGTRKASRDDEEDEDEDEPKKKKGKRPEPDEDDEEDEPKKKKKRPDPDDDDDEDEEDEPKKKKGKPSKDEEDEDEDEDEEDAKKRIARLKAKKRRE